MTKCSTCGRDFVEVVTGQPCPSCGATSQSSGGSAGSGTGGYEPIAARGMGGESKAELPVVAARGEGRRPDPPVVVARGEGRRPEPYAVTARSSDEEPGGPRTVPLTADRLAATLDDLRRVSKEDGNVKFVRLTISDDMPSSELIDINTHSFGSKSAFTVTRLLFERYEIPTSCSDLQKLYYEVCEKAKDTVAESLAQQIDSLAWEPLTGKWVTRDPGNLGSTAQQVASFQDAAHRLLLGQPIKDLVVRLDPGLPGTSGLEFVIDQVPVDNIDDPLGSLKRAIEITGIVVGAMSGNPPLMLTSAKMLVHDEFHHALAESIKRFLFGSGQEKNPRHSDKVSFAHGERYVEPPAFLPELGGWGMHGRGWG